MLFVSLAYHSLLNRKLTTGLTILSIALSVALLVGVEHVRVGARETFARAISQVDLVVGPRTGSLELLLYGVFHAGAPTNNISYASYDAFRTHPAVAWTIPYSLGDSHYGFRVVGTTDDFYTHYRYHGDRRLELSAGRPASALFDVTLGSEVAQSRHYTLGDRIVLSHGLSAGRGLVRHEDKPFHVVGILAKTATPVDRALYITLAGVEAMHIDWTDGGPPLPGGEIAAALIDPDALKVDQITGFFLRAKSRIDTLQLQREVDTFAKEPLMAVIPGVALNELWQTIGYAETALSAMSFMVLLVGLLGMLVSVYTSLDGRRREMSILRAVGAGPGKIAALLVLESGLLSAAGTVLGVALVYAVMLVGQPAVERRFGLFVPIVRPTSLSYAYMATVCVFGAAIGLVPAMKAYRNALSDGLSTRI